MRFATSRAAGFLVIGTLMVPMVSLPGIFAICNDPHRWSKPDVYLCLSAVVYATVVGALYATSSRFRYFIAGRFDAWWGVAFNPFIVVMIGFQWAHDHDPVFPLFILLLIGWFQRRKARKQGMTRTEAEDGQGHA